MVRLGLIPVVRLGLIPVVRLGPLPRGAARSITPWCGKTRQHRMAGKTRQHRMAGKTRLLPYYR